MTELTRRQMRELERSGSQQPDFSAPQEVVSQVAVSIAEQVVPAESVSNVLTQERPLTRRELRQRSEAMSTNTSQNSTLERASALAKTLGTPDIEQVSTERSPKPPARQALPEQRRYSPLPPVGQSRREVRCPKPEIATGQSTAFMESVDVEIPEDGLRGANYLGEPSTQSIVLDVAPEAMSLSVSTGEVFTTGSIAILPDTTGATTGTLDGLDLDQEEAVTGVISVVDPVSARDLIDERSPLGVVPSNVLRRGWWRPWVVGPLSLVMAITAILASITIFNALGD